MNIGKPLARILDETLRGNIAKNFLKKINEQVTPDQKQPAFHLHERVQEVVFIISGRWI